MCHVSYTSWMSLVIWLELSIYMHVFSMLFFTFLQGVEHLTVAGVLESLGLTKYEITFRAEEVSHLLF